MRSRIINWSLALVAVLLLPQVSKAQIAASNPLEWIALAEGNELINGQIEKQIKGQTQTALLQNSIAAEFNRIHEWQKQYNGYLKTLWALNDKLSAFSRKLHLLYLSIRYYTFNDVWRNVTAGMLDRNNGEVARMAMSRWRRAASLTR